MRWSHLVTDPKGGKKTVAPISMLLVLRNYLNSKEHSNSICTIKSKSGGDEEERNRFQTGNFTAVTGGNCLLNLESRGNCLLNLVSSKGIYVF